jgi:hypothetical protein
MSARDLDLVIGAAAIAFAGVLARLADPATALVVLAITLCGAIIWLGDERLEALWQAYCAEPPPRRVPRMPPPPPRPRSSRRPLVQPTLPRAHIVTSH